MESYNSSLTHHRIEAAEYRPKDEHLADPDVDREDSEMMSEGSEGGCLAVGTRPHLPQHRHRPGHGLGVRRVECLRQELRRMTQLALLEEGKCYIREGTNVKATLLKGGRSRLPH